MLSGRSKKRTLKYRMGSWEGTTSFPEPSLSSGNRTQQSSLFAIAICMHEYKYALSVLALVPLGPHMALEDIL